MDRFQQLITEHQAMQNQFTDNADAIGVERVTQYMKNACLAGEIIEDIGQREQIRAILRYWGAYIFERTGDYPLLQLYPYELNKSILSGNQEIYTSTSPDLRQTNWLSMLKDQWAFLLVSFFSLLFVITFINYYVSVSILPGLFVKEARTLIDNGGFQNASGQVQVEMVVVTATPDNSKPQPSPGQVQVETVVTTATPGPFVGFGTNDEGGRTGPTQYTIQAGDTLTKISSQFGVTVNDIMRANNIVDANYIQTGQVLIIPAPTQ
jgi:LysM repeat protein